MVPYRGNSTTCQGFVGIVLGWPARARVVYVRGWLLVSFQFLFAQAWRYRGGHLQHRLLPPVPLSPPTFPDRGGRRKRLLYIYCRDGPYRVLCLVSYRPGVVPCAVPCIVPYIVTVHRNRAPYSASYRASYRVSYRMPGANATLPYLTLPCVTPSCPSPRRQIGWPATRSWAAWSSSGSRRSGTRPFLSSRAVTSARRCTGPGLTCGTCRR